MEVQPSDNLFKHRYYKLNEILLKLTGQWPNQGIRERSIFLAILFLISVSQVIPQAIAIIKHLYNGDFVVEFVTPLIFAGFLVTKLFFSLLNSKQMLRLLNHIQMDWNDLAHDRDVDILHEYAERGRSLTILYVVLGYSSCGLFAAQPIVPKIIDTLLRNGTEPGEFPVPLDYLIIDDLQKYYFYIILHFTVAIFAAFSIIIAHDTLFLVYIHHGCGLYAGLRYAKLIEATYSWCFFFMLGFNIFLIVATGLQVVGATVEPQETLRFIGVNVIAIVHLYVKCYMAQILMDHSIIIHDYILNSEWYRLPLKAQKLLLLIMMRCNVPCKITAGNISVMSMEQFSVILKTSMSYFTLLRSI